MPTKEDIDDLLLQRIAIAALACYPDIATDEPEYQLADNVIWCLQPLTGLDQRHYERLELLIGQTITDPTRYRQDLFGAVLGLIPS